MKIRVKKSYHHCPKYSLRFNFLIHMNYQKLPMNYIINYCYAINYLLKNS